ncbi:MAG: NUDIX domain-containing protein [Ardenticatenaceae bacterium]|nr:NUDIX domain-containing protein [Ardenticatenaceae bacterium]
MNQSKQEFLQFESQAALEAWLRAKKIDIDAWGGNGAKRIADLWEELQCGDCFLQDDPPLRSIHLAEVIIERDGKRLIEAEQELGDGTRRQRRIPPSEKMRPDEDILLAALRGLREELQVSPEAITLLPQTHWQRQRELDSPSYPGLPTQYTIHRIEAVVDGLPDEDFWCDNLAFAHGDPVRRQRWTWVER